MNKNEMIEMMLEKLRVSIESIEWGKRDKHPVLRTPVTARRLASYEEKIGGKLPEEYAHFLRLANGMEGASSTEWLIRGTSEVRHGTKFKVVEREFLPTDDYHPRFDFYRNDVSPNYNDSLLIGTDFVTDVAILFKDKDIYLPRVYIYRAPDMIDPIHVFEDFVGFMEYVLATYLEKLPGGDEAPILNNAIVTADDDLYYDEEAYLGDGPSDEELERIERLGEDLIDDDFEDYGGYDESIKDLDLIDNYDEDESGEAISDDLPIRKKGTKAAKSKKVAAPLPPEQPPGDLDSIMNKIRSAADRHAGDRHKVEVPEVAPEQPPEMRRAGKLVEFVVKELLKNEYLELKKGSSSRSDLEDFMLRKLLNSNSQRDAVKNWFEVLLSAKEVEDLYGTDEEVLDLLNRCFDEFDE